MRRIRTTRRIATAVLAVSTLLLAGCGGGGGSAAQPAADGTVAVNVGETPGIPQLFMQFGVDKGFYHDQGLNVTVTPIPGGSQQVTSVLSGATDMTGTDVVTWINARAQGLPLSLVGPGSAATADPKADFSTVQVPADSPIKKPGDLAGKTIAVNNLNNIGTITIRGALDKAGIDSSQVKFVEVGFPDMLAALAKKSVDAIWIIEPFSSIGLAKGNRAVMYPYAEYDPSMQIGLIATSTKWAASNAGAVTKFQAAHNQTADYIAKNPDEFKAALAKLQGVPPQQVAGVSLPVWNQNVDFGSMQQVAESMVKYGILTAVPNIKDNVLPGA
jgi:NitT/TauT family transport system substrate-binding protein